MKSAALALIFPFMSPLVSTAANYSAQKLQQDGLEVVRLTDAARKVQVSVVPAMGNNAYEMTVNGKNIFWFPFESLEQFRAKPTLTGNPFLAPWANRLDHEGFYANEKHYALDGNLGNFRKDNHGQPIHGLLAYSPAWQVVELNADDKRAEVRSRLEFWRYPDYMAQFPFAHTIDMTYRLRDGTLEVETVLENHSKDTMPVSVGYHPYFRLHDAPRDEWTVHLPVNEHVELSPKLVPTGAIKPVPYTVPLRLAGVALDDVFSGLEREANGQAEFSVQGRQQKISVLYGPKYPVAVVYAPPGRDFICFEPMSGPTNVFNLHHAGKYAALQTVPSGGTWKESFWIRPSGF